MHLQQSYNMNFKNADVVKEQKVKGELDAIVVKMPPAENGSILGFTIPINIENTDYQKYLAWVAEGNKAEPAD